MKKRDVWARWKRHGLKFKIFTAIAAIALFTIVPLLVVVLVATFIGGISFVSAFSNLYVWFAWIAIELFMGIGLLVDYERNGSRRVLKVNRDLENSHFMTDAEIEADAGFTVTKFSLLHGVKDGILISEERKRDDLNVVLHTPIHTLIIATTRTGKTSTYVSPSIEILSRTKTKPCMVITDPKGELYARHARTLAENGYHVHIIDMADTYHSTLWNPFNDVIKKTDKINEEIEMLKNKYVWGGVKFDTYKEAEECKREFAVRLHDEVYIDLQDLIFTACPVEAAQDKSWQQGARDLIFGMVVRMWEDYLCGYLPKEKFNLYNLWWNLTEYAKSDCEILKRYIEDCAIPTSRAAGQANTVLVSEDRTLTSYLGSVNQYMHWLADGGVAQLTSGNEIEFSAWDEEANVLFIKIPDIKEGRHSLVTLLLIQLYKALLEKAQLNMKSGETDAEKLKRNCYFLMDEFGSLPRVHNFEKIVPIAAGRKIFLMPVIQDYNQLDSTYGREAAGTIKNNCNVRVFLGTNDDKTRAEISEACGKQKVKNVSYSENKEMNVSTSAQSVPLIYPAELSKLNNPEDGIFGNSVILVQGTPPIKSHSTPYFEALDIFGINEGEKAPGRDFMFFNEEENRYDIFRLVNYMEVAENTEEIISKPVTIEERVQAEEAATVEDMIAAKARKIINKKIATMINELRSLVSGDDFLRIAVATRAERIKILEELLEKAVDRGEMNLSARLTGFLVYFEYPQGIEDEQAINDTFNECIR